MEGLYRNSPTLFRTVPSPTPYGLLLPKIWVRNPTQPKTPIAIISGTGMKSYGFQNCPEHSQGPSEQNPVKNFGEEGAWAYPGTAQFLGIPYYLRNYELQILCAY